MAKNNKLSKLTPIPTSELIDYLEDNLTIQRREEIETIFLDNPHYFKILKGLLTLRDRLGGTEDIEDFLNESKDKIRENIHLKSKKKLKSLSLT